MDHKAIKVIEEVCNDFDGNGIFSVGAIGALHAMSRHWKDHLAEGHNPMIISEDIDEMKNYLEVMRAEIMRRMLAPEDVAKKAFVIYSPNESAISDGAGFFNNDLGWVEGMENATRFTADEIAAFNLPIATGEDARWMELIAEGGIELSALHALWEELGDIPVNSADEIDAPFLSFPVGTPREDIWHWFECRNPAFRVGDVMCGNQKRNKYELTLRGFDGGTDETDDRIIAVSSPMGLGALREFLDCMAHSVVDINELSDGYDAIDFRLPEDVAALRARVKAVLSA